MIRKLATGAPAAPPAPPAPATTTASGPAPKPGVGKTLYQQWQEMGPTTMAGSLFYRANSAEIEKTRPPPGT
jgi:hypothetical protein